MNFLNVLAYQRAGFTGYKITIHDLTPFHERVEDVPVLIKRKSNQKEK